MEIAFDRPEMLNHKDSVRTNVEAYGCTRNGLKFMEGINICSQQDSS
jgi:hypothetical protein